MRLPVLAVVAAGVFVAAVVCAVPGASAAPAALTAAADATSPAIPDVTGAAFPSASSGWAIGTVSSGSGSGGSAIWHTSTGGASWQTQWHGGGQLLSITATDQAHAWAILGSELLGTSDGGTTWRVLATLPRNASQVDFATARLGVLTVDSCAANPDLSRCPGQILVTSNGGTAWKPVLSGSMPVFAVADAQGRLWAAEPSASGRVTFLTSTDTGRSWRRLGTAKLTYPVSTEVQITLGVSGGRLALASEFDLNTCAMHGCLLNLLSTADGGGSWRQVNLPDTYPDECAPIGMALSVGRDGSVWVGLSRNGAACSPPLGLLYHATAAGAGSPGGGSPGGGGWLQLPPWPLSGIDSLDAVNAQVLYAIGDGGTLSRSTDGGQQWTQVRPAPVPAGELDAAGPGLAFGAQDEDGAGAILRDGRDGWSQLVDLPGVVTQLDFPTPADGVALTYAPDTTPGWRLWISTDGGATWTASGALPSGQELVGPWLAPGGQGLLLTEDGGEPWAPQNDGSSGPVREWVTSDWGATWRLAGTLSLGRDTPDGPASFVYANGVWTGWLAVNNASFNTVIDAVSGDRLSQVPGHPPADGLQLTGPGTGFAWGIGYRGQTLVLELYRTNDGGRSWQRSSSTPPSSPAAPLPLLGFSSAEDGWLVSGDVTLVTTDGGRTWSR